MNVLVTTELRKLHERALVQLAIARQLEELMKVDEPSACNFIRELYTIVEPSTYGFIRQTSSLVKPQVNVQRPADYENLVAFFLSNNNTPTTRAELCSRCNMRMQTLRLVLRKHISSFIQTTRVGCGRTLVVCLTHAAFTAAKPQP